MAIAVGGREKSGVVGRHIDDLRKLGNQIGPKWGNNHSIRLTTKAKQQWPGIDRK
jgi:hypothetical protein